MQIRVFPYRRRILKRYIPIAIQDSRTGTFPKRYADPYKIRERVCFQNATRNCMRFANVSMRSYTIDMLLHLIGPPWIDVGADHTTIKDDHHIIPNFGKRDQRCGYSTEMRCPIYPTPRSSEASTPHSWNTGKHLAGRRKINQNNTQETRQGARARRPVYLPWCRDLKILILGYNIVAKVTGKGKTHVGKMNAILTDSHLDTKTKRCILVKFECDGTKARIWRRSSMGRGRETRTTVGKSTGDSS